MWEVVSPLYLVVIIRINSFMSGMRAFKFYKSKFLTTILISLPCSLIAIMQMGCSSQRYYGSTPVVQKQAKRAYNKSYKIKGQDYHPRKSYEYSQTGIASYYGGRDVFHGRKTSTGEVFDKNGLTAAHKTLPLPSIVRVTNLKNGRSIKLRINDRGPFVKGRIIDVSEKAAKMLGFYLDGVAQVKVECLVGESMTLAHRYNPKECNPYTLYGTFPLQGQPQNTNQDTISVKEIVNRNLNRMTHAERSQQPQQNNIDSMPPAKPAYIRPYSVKDVQSCVSKNSPSSSPISLSTAGILPRGTYIQIGTYSSPMNANNFAVKVETRMRVPCKTYKSGSDAAPMYRVLMGPMSSTEATEKMLHELKIRNVTDAFVVVQK